MNTTMIQFSVLLKPFMVCGQRISNPCPPASDGQRRHNKATIIEYPDFELQIQQQTPMPNVSICRKGQLMHVTLYSYWLEPLHFK